MSCYHFLTALKILKLGFRHIVKGLHDCRFLSVFRLKNDCGEWIFDIPRRLNQPQMNHNLSKLLDFLSGFDENRDKTASSQTTKNGKENGQRMHRESAKTERRERK